MNFKLGLAIKTSRETTFRALSNPATLPCWASAVEEMELLDGAEEPNADVGFVQWVREGRHRKRYEGKIKTYIPNQELSVELGEDGYRLVTVYRTEPQGEGTLLKVSTHFSGKRFWVRGVAVLLRPLYKRRLKKLLLAFKRWVESTGGEALPPLRRMLEPALLPPDGHHPDQVEAAEHLPPNPFAGAVVSPQEKDSFREGPRLRLLARIR